MAEILLPLPARDSDPTEVAVSWRVLTARGHHVTFATPHGQPAECDPIMLSGAGLDRWSRVPVIGRFRPFGWLLRANKDARAAHAAMIADPAFQHPIAWDAIDPAKFDGLLLPGGHRARGMRAYLESPVLQSAVAAFFAAGKPVAAICHGVLLAARSHSADGRSVLHGRKTTALTWAQERTADRLAHIGRPWDRDYYRTYLEAPNEPAGYMSVEQEVTRALADPGDFAAEPPPGPNRWRQMAGLRDSAKDLRAGFVVRDGNYVSARWPGDAHAFATAFADLLA
jgi:putative intracellular protease/amidase